MQIKYTLKLMDHDAFGDLGYKKIGTYYGNEDETKNDIIKMHQKAYPPIRNKPQYILIFHRA